jgi:hypothetical protein
MSRIVPTAAFVLRDVELEFEGVDDYAPAASSVTFTPTSSTVTFAGLAPEGQLTDTTEPSWALALVHVQDWESSKSLSRYLYANAGKKVAVKFKPRAGAGLPAFNSTVTLAAGAIGGASAAFPTSTVTMGCTRPELDSDDSPATVEPDYPAA